MNMMEGHYLDMVTLSGKDDGIVTLMITLHYTRFHHSGLQ